MRKQQQRQILELIETLKEAQTAGLYAACQDCALRIGEFIESVEGEGTRTVAFLEEYCELLFKAGNGEIGRKGLRKHLIKVENSIRSELRPNRLEVAFLSYNASMSDAIKSIYLAAKADPSCDAFWIPIPFYEKNNDGSFGEMHYEGADCYGENFECVDWREYDIAARRPDVIFTFAPYDGGNYVTSVHPDFYCERLWNLTDCLVYSPYFVAADDVPEHFCTVAGCVFAHKVVLQSEKVRDTYIRVFKERYGRKFGKPEDKFVALGSPKLDKIHNLKREDYILPDAWKKLIGDKKVIFYNTSVGTMLAFNEEYLEKLRSVFDTFRERNEIVLWWRPHPLSEATYKSMRPRMLDEYEQIIDDFKREGWGIYDDTPDLHRALAWSDAYYGDGSSVARLFEVCGKPVIFQVIGKNLNNAFLNFSSLTAHDGFLYLTDNRLNNVIWKLDLNDLTLKYHLGLPDYPVDKFLQFHNTKFYKGKFYILPFYGNSVIVYNMETETVEEIHIPIDDALKNESKGCFTHLGNLFYKDKLFLFPFRYKAIISIDIKTKEVAFHTKWVEVMQKKSFNTDGMLFEPYAVLNDTKVLLPSLSSNCVLEFDLETGASKAHQVGNTDVSFSGIFINNGMVWLICYNKPLILKWDMNAHSVTELYITYQGFSSYGSPFSTNVVQYESSIFLFPKNSNMVLKVNMETDEITKVDAFDPYCTSEPDRKNICVFDGVIMQNDWIFANSDNTQKVFLYHVPSASFTVLDKNELRRTISKADLMKVVNTIIKSLDAKHKIHNSSGLDGTAGQKIFHFAKDLILG